MQTSPSGSPESNSEFTTRDLCNVDVVIAQLLQRTGAHPETESVPLFQALDRILAQDITSPETVPPFDNSAVDGYAVADLSANELPVSQRIPAGVHPVPLRPGTAARIFTGATIPEGACAVIMQEDTKSLDDGTRVAFTQTARTGQNIRNAGQDVQRGDTILCAGQALNPQRLGMVASVGIPVVPVYKRLRVAFFSTGDELVEPGSRLQPGQIYNSNRYMLKAMLEKLNFDPLDLGLVPDTLAATMAVLDQASRLADVIISTGGASVGEEDHIHRALQAGGQVEMWRVAIKPGKPFMFGSFNQTPVIGLPGNPGAVLVTFAVLARPFLLRKQGKGKVLPSALKLPLAFNLGKPGKRREYLRVRIAADGRLVQHPNQSSGMLSSASWADGLAVIPEMSTVQSEVVEPSSATSGSVDYYAFCQLFSLDD